MTFLERKGEWCLFLSPLKKVYSFTRLFVIHFTGSRISFCFKSELYSKLMVREVDRLICAGPTFISDAAGKVALMSVNLLQIAEACCRLQTFH